MPKYKYSQIINIPESVDFTKLEQESVERGYDIDAFEISDLGKQMQNIEDDLQYERLVLQVLLNLDQREKLIFMFQLLRDYGFALDHGSCAKTLNINRQGYMKLLGIVRKKASLIVYQTKNNTNRVI